MIRRLLRRQRPLPEVEHVIRVAGTGEEFAVSREGFLAIMALTNEEDSMNDTRFTVEFRAEPPANAKVGDEFEISGLVTIQRIGADLVDVSDGDRTAYLPGEITIELWANHLEIKAT